MDIEQLKKNMQNFVDKEVLILKGHPWEGEKGRTVSVEVPNGLEKPAMKVKLDNGTECFVFEAKHLFFITSKRKLN